MSSRNVSIPPTPETDDSTGIPLSGVETIKSTDQQRGRFEMVFKAFIAQIENGHTVNVARFISARIKLRINPKSKTKGKTYSTFEVLNYMESEFKIELEKTFPSPNYKVFFNKTYLEFITKTRAELMEMRESKNLATFTPSSPPVASLSLFKAGGADKPFSQHVAERVRAALEKKS